MYYFFLGDFRFYKNPDILTSLDFGPIDSNRHCYTALTSGLLFKQGYQDLQQNNLYKASVLCCFWSFGSSNIISQQEENFRRTKILHMYLVLGFNGEK